jgi:glycosyltransferase domain-containing protein
MQGKYVTQSALKLDELLTVVLITHNRPAFLRRALQYYSTLPCKVLILDSSTEACEGVVDAFEAMEYHHVPQFGYWEFQNKIEFGVRKVTTPYMVFAADDDFIVHDALYESVGFLQSNPDYGMCHGYCLMYITLGKKVAYYRRDKKVGGDYGSDSAAQRVVDCMSEFLPPFYAVTRTPLLKQWYASLPERTSLQWQEIGHVYFLVASAKARLLDIAYVVREMNVGTSEHNTEISHSLYFTDEKSVAEREAFADFLATLPVDMPDYSVEQRRQVVLDAFAALLGCLQAKRTLTFEPLVDSTWNIPEAGPERRFGPKQYVEMPFYNQAFFDKLTQIEFLLHAMPAGRLQMQVLEGIWVRQEQLLVEHDNDVLETIIARLWDAMDLNPFNRRIVRLLAEKLEGSEDVADAQNIKAWAERLDAVSDYDSQKVLGNMHSGRILEWLAPRSPSTDEHAAIGKYLAAKDTPPQFGLLVLDLDNDMRKLQTTLDSLVEGPYKGFKIVVFTTGDLPSATNIENILHFVKVSQSNYVDKLNQITRQLNTDWLLLLNAGDQFTAAGLLQAGLELLAAPQCRAVFADEIHRQPDGALRDVFRPGFNLDLLQSNPALMARHWLVRRDVLLEAGGYSVDFAEALEFDLLLRIIQQGGIGWLAHLDEPLLICDAPSGEENAHERLSLSRHLSSRGYKVQISSELKGTYQIDYRHAERPLVSIVLHGQASLEQLQKCLTSVQQRTRYLRFEVLIGAHEGLPADTLQWLMAQEQPGGRVRIVEIAAGLTASAACNAVAAQAHGEYLLWLAADAEVVSPNWVGTLLNQALRPEVGIVGARLTDKDSKITQAGLILGLNGSIGSPFIGATQDEAGYMQRLKLTQNYSAVSATCLMVRKELFDGVGGFDEGDFAEAFADVDLCLNIGQSGYLTVWVPQAHIQHPGTLPDAASAMEALRSKWSGQFAQDLAYNKNLALTGKGFTLGDVSGVNWAGLLV